MYIKTYDHIQERQRLQPITQSAPGLDRVLDNNNLHTLLLLKNWMKPLLHQPTKKFVQKHHDDDTSTTAIYFTEHLKNSRARLSKWKNKAKFRSNQRVQQRQQQGFEDFSPTRTGTNLTNFKRQRKINRQIRFSIEGLNVSKDHRISADAPKKANSADKFQSPHKFKVLDFSNQQLPSPRQFKKQPKSKYSHISEFIPDIYSDYSNNKDSQCPQAEICSRSNRPSTTSRRRPRVQPLVEQVHNQEVKSTKAKDVLDPWPVRRIEEQDELLF